MKTKMKDLLDKILSANLKLKESLNTPEIETDETLPRLLELKDILITQLQALKKENKKEFTQLKNEEFQATWHSIAELEKENITLLKAKKEKLSKEINATKTQSKVINKYKYKKEQEPRLFDDSL